MTACVELSEVMRLDCWLWTWCNLWDVSTLCFNCTAISLCTFIYSIL